jgi:hypothetical protein
MGELLLRQHRDPLKVTGFYPGEGARSLSKVPEDVLFNIAQTKGVGSEMILASYLRYQGETTVFWGAPLRPTFLALPCAPRWAF